MEKGRRTSIEQAEFHVEKTILNGARESLNCVESKQHGEGCQCPNCLKMAVSEVNSYLDMLDPEGKYPRYHTDSTYIWTEDAE